MDTRSRLEQRLAVHIMVSYCHRHRHRRHRHQRLSQRSPSEEKDLTPIAPLTPHHHKDGTFRPTGPSCSSEPDLTVGLRTPVESIPGHSYIPLPDALHDRWAKRKSSHVILADNSLQLKVFSELSVELDEVLGLYTTGKTA
ncbi:hypothetical protein E4T51_10831 [Aureobasidium sp. EXF-12344]|nr:hypothetical protein E4T51_10831 [Aureobasidium sp. EXF-12344]